MPGKTYYDNIDEISIFNWRRCLEEQLFEFCRIDPSEKDEKNDERAWDVIYDTFLKEFGLGKDYKRILELQLEISELQCDFVIEDNNFMRNLIRRLERELQELMEKPVENDMDATITILKKWLGFPIDQKKVTIREFYKDLRMYEKECEQLKNAS